MSAENQRKAYRYNCNMMRPQIYSEKSLMESVVDFFSDVVPQAYSPQKVEDKEKIQWVRFENCDCSDIGRNPDLYKYDTKGLPLLLILGYSNGIQIWHITPNGEALEILSVRQGPVKICRILPNPEPALGYTDSFASKRPLIVMCDSSSAGQPFCGMKFVSLKTGDEVHSISFKTLPIHNIECNKRFLVVTFLEKICIYESCGMKQLFWITSCFPCPGPNVNPVALSTRWLAYADKRLVPMHQSCGGMSGDGTQSYAATVISAAKGAFKGLSMFGEAMMNSMTGCKPSGPKKQPDYVHLDNGNRPGIVSVVDIQNVHNDHFNVNEDNEGSGLIAHFHAHANEPVADMAFDPTGTLLVTACKLGHNFHIFRLMAHPCSSSLGAVHHLYTLHRGDTTAKVIDVSFNHDSRWVTVSTHRGTTHIFAITPYGGIPNVRTHCQPFVVNRASRFHRSAGLEDIEHSPLGRRSPVLSTSPSSSGHYDRYPTLIQQNTLNNNMGNPRLPPYPHPITLYPLYQIKQPLNVVLNPANKNMSPNHSPTGTDNIFAVASKFCTPRLCVVGSPKLDVERREAGKRPVDCLFIMAQSGSLVEYVLEPKARTVSEKVSDESLLELNVVGRMQWSLQRLKTSTELRPPLPTNSPLLLSHEAVISQVPTAPEYYDLPGLTRHDSKDSLSSDHSGKDEDEWVSQVEIITHAGPHRRLWMGPQFSFKTYQENTTVLSSNSSALLSQSAETNMVAMDITGEEGDLESLKVQPTRSNPVSMPNARPAYRRLSSDSSPSPGLSGHSAPLLIEAGSFDQSPHLLDVYSNWTESTVEKQPRVSDDMEEDRIKETLADAMVESPMRDMEKLSLRQELPRANKSKKGAAKKGSEEIKKQKVGEGEKVTETERRQDKGKEIPDNSDSNKTKNCHKGRKKALNKNVSDTYITSLTGSSHKIDQISAKDKTSASQPLKNTDVKEHPRKGKNDPDYALNMDDKTDPIDATMSASSSKDNAKNNRKKTKSKFAAKAVPDMVTEPQVSQADHVTASVGTNMSDPNKDRTLDNSVEEDEASLNTGNLETVKYLTECETIETSYSKTQLAVEDTSCSTAAEYTGESVSLEKEAAQRKNKKKPKSGKDKQNKKTTSVLDGDPKQALQASIIVEAQPLESFDNTKESTVSVTMRKDEVVIFSKEQQDNNKQTQSSLNDSKCRENENSLEQDNQTGTNAGTHMKNNEWSDSPGWLSQKKKKGRKSNKDVTVTNSLNNKTDIAPMEKGPRLSVANKERESLGSIGDRTDSILVQDNEKVTKTLTAQKDDSSTIKPLTFSEDDENNDLNKGDENGYNVKNKSSTANNTRSENICRNKNTKIARMSETVKDKEEEHGDRKEKSTDNLDEVKNEIKDREIRGVGNQAPALQQGNISIQLNLKEHQKGIKQDKISCAEISVEKTDALERSPSFESVKSNLSEERQLSKTDGTDSEVIASAELSDSDMFEVKSKKKRKKKKVEIEESLYFEAIEPETTIQVEKEEADAGITAVLTDRTHEQNAKVDADIETFFDEGCVENLVQDSVQNIGKAELTQSQSENQDKDTCVSVVEKSYLSIKMESKSEENKTDIGHTLGKVNSKAKMLMQNHETVENCVKLQSLEPKILDSTSKDDMVGPVNKLNTVTCTAEISPLLSDVSTEDTTPINSDMSLDIRSPLTDLTGNNMEKDPAEWEKAAKVSSDEFLTEFQAESQTSVYAIGKLSIDLKSDTEVSVKDDKTQLIKTPTTSADTTEASNSSGRSSEEREAKVDTSKETNGASRAKKKRKKNKK